MRIELDSRGTDAAEDFLAASGMGNGWILEDAVLKRAWLVALFPDEQSARQTWNGMEKGFRDLGTMCLGEPSYRALVDTDWRDSYKAHFKAWHFGRLHWVPTWERDAFLLPEGDAVLWLDPGLAFGTGNHETTRLCVERLVAVANQRGVLRPAPASPRTSRTLGAVSGLEGLKVVDAGCGSGILALSAVLLGFSNVIGFDNDPEAIRASRENAATNGLSGGVDFFAGDLADGLAGRRADVLLANIQADVLMGHASALACAIEPGGSLIMSGILAEENAQVRAVFEALCVHWAVDARTLGEWSDLVLVRPSPN